MINYISQKQFTIDGFENPFFQNLDPQNRWVKLSSVIPWDDIVKEYIKNMRVDFGRKGINPRTVIGALIIKHKCGFSDDETILHIKENVYMQYFVGYQGFSNKSPFDSSLFVAIRERMSKEVFDQMNEMIMRKVGLIHEDRQSKVSDKEQSTSEQAPNETEATPAQASPTNKGTVLIDATVCPQAVKYPTDLELLSDSRKKSEELIDLLYKQELHGEKPRTDRKRARGHFLEVAKKRKKSKMSIKRAIRKQLFYLNRNIKSIAQLLSAYKYNPLEESDNQYLNVIKEVHRQQSYMLKNGVHSIQDRIVNIHQPYVRPMVRGKAGKEVEFGAKISVSLVEGYSYIEKLSWDAYNEGTLLEAHMEAYKKRFGYYPDRVLVDKIYATRANRAMLKSKGIKLVGKPLGRPPTNQEPVPVGERNPIEGKFGQGKWGYGLDRIKARLQSTSESWISAIFFVMNLIKLVRSSPAILLSVLKIYFTRTLLESNGNINRMQFLLRPVLSNSKRVLTFSVSPK